MSISQETHDRLTRIELHSLIAACERCDCLTEVPCYCASNIEWAQRALEKLEKRKEDPTP